jgi:hypothetical protein
MSHKMHAYGQAYRRSEELPLLKTSRSSRCSTALSHPEFFANGWHAASAECRASTFRGHIRHVALSQYIVWTRELLRMSPSRRQTVQIGRHGRQPTQPDNKRIDVPSRCKCGPLHISTLQYCVVFLSEFSHLSHSGSEKRCKDKVKMWCAHATFRPSVEMLCCDQRSW